MSKLAVFVIVAAVAALVPATASAMSGQDYARQLVREGDTRHNVVNTFCVGDSSLHADAGRIAYGSYNPDTWYVKLSTTRVCQPLAQYRQGGPLTEAALHALVTIGHEVAHAQGTVYEASAECQGVRRTMQLVRHYGASSSQQAWARDVLVRKMESTRPPEYRLVNVNCRVA
jgi:hypothetical protein